MPVNIEMVGLIRFTREKHDTRPLTKRLVFLSWLALGFFDQLVNEGLFRAFSDTLI